jgi:GT2 family glycosyltransferase
MQKMRLNAQEVISYKFPSCFRDAPGACIALSRDAFIKVGGCCELFKVYGWEDVYFRYKVKTLTKQTCLNAQMIHMPHETNYQIDKQPVNAPLYHELLYTDNGDCVKLSMRDREYLLSHYPTIRR